MSSMRLGKLLLTLFSIASLASACAAGPSELQYPPGKTLKITKVVWAYYQSYLTTLGGKLPGVFLVAVNGGVGRGARYMYCPTIYDRCAPKAGGAVNETNQMCKKDGLTCVLFARDSHILVPYQIID